MHLLSLSTYASRIQQQKLPTLAVYIISAYQLQIFLTFTFFLYKCLPRKLWMLMFFKCVWLFYFSPGRNYNAKKSNWILDKVIMAMKGDLCYRKTCLLLCLKQTGSFVYNSKLLKAFTFILIKISGRFYLCIYLRQNPLNIINFVTYLLVDKHKLTFVWP